MKAERLSLSVVLFEQLVLYYEDFKRGNHTANRYTGAAVCRALRRGSLERVFHNLVKTLAHGKGGLAVTASAEEGWVRATFCSRTESSVDPEQLFNRFYTADKSRARGNTGLGLMSRACVKHGRAGERCARRRASVCNCGVAGKIWINRFSSSLNACK